MSRQTVLTLLLILALAGAGYTFVSWQQATTSAAIANTSQFVSEARRATAAADLQNMSTSQALLEFGQSTAVAIAQLAITAQAQARLEEATAVANANAAATAVANAEFNEATAVANAALAATAQNVAESNAATTAATALIAQNTASAQIDTAQTASAQLNVAETTAALMQATQSALVAQIDTLQTTATAQTLALLNTPVPLQPTAGPAQTTQFVSQSRNLQFDYPPGWLVQEASPDVVYLANNAETARSQIVPPGGILALIYTIPRNPQQNTTLIEDAIIISERVAENLSGERFAFDEVSVITINGFPAARLTGVNNVRQGVIYLIDQGGPSYILAIATTSPGELDLFDPEFQRILESVRYQPNQTAAVPTNTALPPPATPVVVTSSPERGPQRYDKNNLRFDYPAGWVLQEQSDGSEILLGNTQAALDIISPSGDGIIRGQAQIAFSIFFLPRDEIGASVVEPAVLLRAFARSLSQAADAPVFTDTAPITVNGRAGAEIFGTSATFETRIIVVNVDETGFLVIFSVYSKGEGSDFAEAFALILNSIDYTPA